MGEVFNYDRVITHSTIFHADDVFGVALCKLLNPIVAVTRTLEVEEALKRAEEMGEKAIVFDIGLGKYDHHQPDKALRVDGTPYCGFGLLWRDFGHKLCPDHEAWEKVDQNFVLAIDKADNGVAQNMVSTSIKAMNPTWDEPRSLETTRFFQAVVMAMTMLGAQIRQANSAVAARDEVIASYTGGEVLILDRHMPYLDVVQTDARFKDVCFVVYPSLRGGWNAQTITKEPGIFVNRMDFPKEWLGHADPERGIHFAHTSNFLIACDTKEQAIKVAEEAVEANRQYATVAYSV